MSAADPPRHVKRGSARWSLVSGTLVMAGVTCLVVSAIQGQPADADQSPAAVPRPHVHGVASGPTTATPKPDPVPTRRPSPTRSRPVALTIPALQIDVPLTRLGVNEDWTVEVPTDADKPGWYRLGVAPGQLGSAVILGHVDSALGPAVFYRLSELGAGDLLSVRLADGSVTHFAVDRVVTYPNDEFPARQVYGSHGYRGLQLITCGGGFDAVAGHYLGNVVVYTKLVSVSQRSDAAPSPAGADQASA